MVDVSCNGVDRDGNGAGVTVTDKKGSLCTFTNRLAYEGRLSIRKETIGNTGTALFQITSPSEPGQELQQIAEVHTEKVPVRARGDSSRGLPFGTYVIQESDAGPAQNGRWSLAEVICNGRAIPFSQGRAAVRLTERSSSASCKFVNVFRPGPAPPAPGPEPGPSQEAEIVVAKTLVKAGSGPTPTDEFRIDVSNRSRRHSRQRRRHRSARPGARGRLGEAEPGRSVHATQYVCLLGAIPPGGRATIEVTAKDTRGEGTYNNAVAGSASPEAKADNNLARASLVKVKRHFPACGSRVVIAHASC